MNRKRITSLIRSNLTDDLLTKTYQRYKKECPDLPNSTGHCYVASEAAYHLLGGKQKGWTSQFIYHCFQPHWFLKHKSGFILDLTADQFQSLIDYGKARGTGFLTKYPSKRTAILLARIAARPIP